MKLVFLISAMILLPSCVSYHLDYSPPTNRDALGSKIVAQPFKNIWPKLIEGLAVQNYVIDSVNKDSGLIVASKKLDPPNAYADCGRWNGHFQNARADEKYDFGGADSDVQYMSKSGEVYAAVHRHVALTSKSNIFVKKIDEKKTS